MDGVVQVASAVIASQSQVAAGGVVDASIPSLPIVIHSARAEGFFHLLVPVGAVTVAVVSAGSFEPQPLQCLLHRTFTLLALRRGCLAEAQAGFWLGHQFLSG